MKDSLWIKNTMLEAIEKAKYDYGNASGGSEDYFIAEACGKVAEDLCSEAKKEVREFYELVKVIVIDNPNTSYEEYESAWNKVEQTLASFTEQEQKELPFE